MTNPDNEQYWVNRHKNLQGSLASVGKVGTPETENRQRYARKKRRIVDLLRDMDMMDLREQEVLDAGCGIGMISELFYELGATVSGIDASPIAIGEARDRASPPPHAPTNFKVGSIVDFSFLPKRFNLVFCLDVLYHVIEDKNWEAAVLNLLRHVQPGGNLILIDQVKPTPERPSPHVHFRTAEMYERLICTDGNLLCTPPGHELFLVFWKNSQAS